MKLAIAAAAFAAAVVATPALAADGPQINWYGDLGYTATDFGGGVDLGTITGRLGGRSAHFGVEGEVGVGVTSKDISGVSVKENDEYALDAVLFAPMEHGDLFIRGGYGRMEIKASCCGGSVTEGDNAWNAGVGGQYFFDAKDGVRGDYTYYSLSNGGGHVNAYTITYVRKF